MLAIFEESWQFLKNLCIYFEESWQFFKESWQFLKNIRTFFEESKQFFKESWQFFEESTVFVSSSFFGSNKNMVSLNNFKQISIILFNLVPRTSELLLVSRFHTKFYP